MSFILREAIKDDAAGITDVQLASWRWAYDGLLPESFLARDPEEHATFWRDMLPYAGDKRMWVAEAEVGEIVGIALAGPARFDDREVNGELWTLYTHPTAARGGVGKALWQAAHDWLKTQGHDGFYVMCMQANPIGLGFYRKMGGTVNPKPFVSNFRGVLVDDHSIYWRF